jgi:very-short-patch-repair endonuclease
VRVSTGGCSRRNQPFIHPPEKRRIEAMKQFKPTNLARALKQEQSDAEHQLWTILGNRQISGLKFRRQQSLGKYVVDFVSFDGNLIIEIDGGQHTEPQNIVKDEQRTRWLEQRGFKVLRFLNNDVLENLESVVAKIKEFVD